MLVDSGYFFSFDIVHILFERQQYDFGIDLQTIFGIISKSASNQKQEFASHGS